MPSSEVLEEALLSLRDINHSMKFLSFFSHYAFPLYQFSPIVLLRDYLPILLCIQGLVYRADFEIERGQKEKKHVQGWSAGKQKLMQILKKLKLYTPQMEREADHLSEYWELENELMGGNLLTFEKLQRAIELRASDILILHGVCEKLSQKPFSEPMRRAIQSIEIIRDIEADLRQYKTDVESGDFNIYKMFIKFYEADAERRLTDELAMRWAALRDQINRLPIEFQQIFGELIGRYHQERPPIQLPGPIADPLLEQRSSARL